MEEEKSTMIDLFHHGTTDDPDIFRVVDMNGNWTHYYIQSKNLYVPAVSWILKIGFPKGTRFYEYLLSVTKQESKQILEAAGDRGTRVHAAIDNLIEGAEISMEALYPNDITGRPEKLNLSEYSCLLAFQAWADRFKPHVIPVKRTLATDSFAGTLDILCSIQLTAGQKVTLNGKLITLTETKRVKVLLDWKTSGGIYSEYKAQVAAYYEAIADDSIEYTGIVRLGTAHKNGLIAEKGYGYEMVIWDKETTYGHIRAFKAARLIYDLESEPFEFSDLKIPFSVKTDIPQHVDEIKEEVNNTDSSEEATVKKTVAKKTNGKKKNVESKL